MARPNQQQGRTAAIDQLPDQLLDVMQPFVGRINREAASDPRCPPEVLALSQFLPHAVGVVKEKRAQDKLSNEDTKMIQEIIKELGITVDARWRHFGILLAVQPELLEAIYKSKLANSSDCMLDLVIQWVTYKEGTGLLPRTWDTVVEAVRGAGFGQLATEMAERHYPDMVD